MARKGKEPAGLRRWRLAQKRKHSPRKARAAPRKVKHMARRRSYGRKRGHSGRKFSMWKLVKGVAYTGAIAAPLYTQYTAGGGGSAGAVHALKHAAFIDTGTGKFSLSNGIYIWGPVAALAVVDFATTKLPIQRRIAKGINNLLG